jgi:primosomal protein N'
MSIFIASLVFVVFASGLLTLNRSEKERILEEQKALEAEKALERSKFLVQLWVGCYRSVESDNLKELESLLDNAIPNILKIDEKNRLLWTVRQWLLLNHKAQRWATLIERYETNQIG